MDPLSAIRIAAPPVFGAPPPLDIAAEARALRPGGINPLEIPQPLRAPVSTDGPQSFEGVLGRLVQEVNEKQIASQAAVRGLMAGEDIPLHRVMIAAEEASVSFQLMVEVRNKLLEAYQELMRMQV
jgi:flagellar hook-basal body complex protein FliE